MKRSSPTSLGAPIPVNAGIAGTACLLSLHKFPLFAPEPGGPSAAVEYLPHPKIISKYREYKNNSCFWISLFVFVVINEMVVYKKFYKNCQKWNQIFIHFMSLRQKL